MAARTAWTDDRIDDLARHVGTRFDVLHDEVHGLRQDMNGLRADMREDMNGLRGDIRSLNGRLTTILLALSVALIGTVGGLVATSL
jgi:hypothetical protein